MQITLELPEDIVQDLRSKWKDLPRLRSRVWRSRHIDPTP